ncbi:unnamed protein product [Boreogadus saida]
MIVPFVLPAQRSPRPNVLDMAVQNSVLWRTSGRGTLSKRQADECSVVLQVNSSTSTLSRAEQSHYCVLPLRA